jgi:thioredoxin-like negative regulator of GroEL
LNVREYLKDFVLVRVLVQSNREIAARHAVTRVPTVFMLNSQGKALGSFTGGKPADDLIKTLKGMLEN